MSSGTLDGILGKSLLAESRFQNDALFKEIGGQLNNSNYNYDKYESTRKSSQASQGQKSPVKTTRPSSVVPRGISSSSSKSKTPISTISRPCSHKKESVPSQVVKLVPAKPKVKTSRDVDVIKILQLRIKARRQTIMEYKERQYDLMCENNTLRIEIDEMERKSHETVKKMLRTYEKYRGGAFTLNYHFDKDLLETRIDLANTKNDIDRNLKNIQLEMDEIEREFEEHQAERNILRNYKHKEYPVRSLHIVELQNEIDSLEAQNEAEIDDLQIMIDTELEKINEEMATEKQEITHTATTMALDKMDPSVESMAEQNVQFQRDIEFHKRQNDIIAGNITDLEMDIQEMRNSAKVSIRKQMFPELFKKRDKCTPDMDVILDIPTQDWLPI